MLRALPLAVLLASMVPLIAAAEPLAVVVPATSSLEEISRQELRRVFLGNQVKDPDGQKLRPLNQPEKSANRVAFDDAVLGMDEAAVGRYWVLQGIRAGGEAPLSLPTEAKLIEVVAALPGGITYTHPNALNDAVKVVSVDGKRPGDPGYLLDLEGVLAAPEPSP